MDSECIEIDPKNNKSTQPDEVESVEKEVGAKRKRKDRSIVWNFFDKDEKGAVKGSNKVPCKCKKCNTHFLYDSIQGTGNLKRHMEKCIGKNYHDVGQMLFNSDMALRSSRFDQNIFRDLLVTATVKHELPLSFVDYKERFYSTSSSRFPIKPSKRNEDFTHGTRNKIATVTSIISHTAQQIQYRHRHNKEYPNLKLPSTCNLQRRFYGAMNFRINLAVNDVYVPYQSTMESVVDERVIEHTIHFAATIHFWNMIG
ncbi:zinc finger, BED-type [Artemisia annua]|uniref:Zinc finger, BED-type n=1 Tax=Artemisia annua TaxID=35608 RepID=A0A2U1P3M4_ARTAN|nr:zinc finger, BED-type [Artemisia annua]